MITRKINIAQWECLLFVSVGTYWIEAITDAFVEIGASESVVKRIRRNMIRNDMDSGFTYSNPRLRRSVMVIGRTSNGSQFINSFTHELRHLVDDIALVDGLEMSGEGVAYLTGDIAMEVADIVCKMSCDHCRRGSVACRCRTSLIR